MLAPICCRGNSVYLQFAGGGTDAELHRAFTHFRTLARILVPVTVCYSGLTQKKRGTIDQSEACLFTILIGSASATLASGPEVSMAAHLCAVGGSGVQVASHEFIWIMGAVVREPIAPLQAPNSVPIQSACERITDLEMWKRYRVQIDCLST